LFFAETEIKALLAKTKAGAIICSKIRQDRIVELIIFDFRLLFITGAFYPKR
jgi:hypothetical protein